MEKENDVLFIIELHQTMEKRKISNKGAQYL